MPTSIDLQESLPPRLLRVDSKSNVISEVDTASLQGKTVLLYFSAHWCPPCRGFTPTLAKVYTALKKKGVEFELVFVSHDKNAGEFETYFRQMAADGGNWLAIPYEGCRREREQMANACGVMGIPALTVIGPDGIVLAPNARNAVASDPVGDGFPWPGASAGAGGVIPPILNARPLDNLYAWRRLLPPGHPLHLAPRSDGGETPGTTAAREREKQRVSYVQQKQERQRNRVNPIDEIASRFQEGPLSLLKQSYEQRSMVRVVTRHDRGVRGVATGMLVAFDKHMNLVLRDVQETYTVLLRIERTTHSGRTRRCRKQEQRQRKLKQVFVAGNSVVLVSRITGGDNVTVAAGENNA